MGVAPPLASIPTASNSWRSGKFNPAPLLSAVAPLSEGPSWFDRLYRKEPGLLKVVLNP